MLKEVAAERVFPQVPRFLPVSIITKLVNTHLQLNISLIRRTREGGQDLTLNLLMTTIVAPPSNASKSMGFNSAFKGLRVN